MSDQRPSGDGPGPEFFSAPGPGAGAPDVAAGVAPTGDAEAGVAPVAVWGPPPPRRRRWVWVSLTILAIVLVLGAAGAFTARLLLDARAEALAARTVSAAQQSVVDAEFARISETTARIGEQATAYRDARASWDAEQEQAAQWRTGTTAPPDPVPNPGGTAMPGGDPTGRAFLDSIGAPQVQLVFDAGADNCGYEAGGSGPYTLVLGGCFDTRFPNSVMLAWEPGTEGRVWAIFVHEVMHWYQYQTFYPAFLAAQRVGVDGDAYGAQLESDASCRAVYQHGIPAWQYANSSAPCDVDGWYDGWFLDHLASLGVPVTEPVAEAYEVSPVVRP
ncbi:hypothetical protein LQ938_12445 [Microbacterium sp. cx-55]|uniref:hypothetical protein n=1 Tax=Microbacterium sp. cx-55 TaxID=2875948 RepID=UPI001CBD7D61|nr:hypothetical protein [Microbacterium sp. cx-55]MBZ4487923.1 hypothetical protein [Microbacterium sp. cx-55]UGB34666.1 hypothetical protein LQ938_12445 [Microbacterium sp. cx-55]